MVLRTVVYVKTVQWKHSLLCDTRFTVKEKTNRDTEIYIVCQDMMVWKPGKLQSYKIEGLCLMLNCTSPCTNPSSQLH